jgi:hypothetical protein
VVFDIRKSKKMQAATGLYFRGKTLKLKEKEEF